jgi:hypothetical protein
MLGAAQISSTGSHPFVFVGTPIKNPKEEQTPLWEQEVADSFRPISVVRLFSSSLGKR